MTINAFLQWLEACRFATAIRESDVLFPWLEALHVLAIALVVGSIALVDLRLLGWASCDRAVRALAAETLPITGIAFVFALITGLLMFCARAMVYGHSLLFLLKLAALLLAGCNMLYFQIVTYRDVEHWGAPQQEPPRAARTAGALSLLFWVCVVTLGRWVGFTT